MSIYPGTTQFITSANHNFIHGKIFYVACDSNGKASVKWHLQYQYGNGSGFAKNPSSVIITNMTADDVRSQVRYKSNVPPSEIYPSLSMQPSEAKIIVATAIFFNTVSLAKKEFGFYFISPKSARTIDLFFEQVVIFTPKPGLFDETIPK